MLLCFMRLALVLFTSLSAFNYCSLVAGAAGVVSAAECY
jgi:hypothetical protein